MPEGRSVDEVIAFISHVLRLPEGDDAFNHELDGIRAELERLRASEVQFHMSRIEGAVVGSLLREESNTR